MRGIIAPTDYEWYRFLLSRPEIREVNFWRPGGVNFRALQPGEPFFFKLKSPRNAIAGFGLFARFAVLPAWQAWDLFEEANGAAGMWELIKRLSRLASPRPGEHEFSPDRRIGCIAITEPVFLEPDEWVATPSDWPSNVVSVMGYDLESGEGARTYRECLERAAAKRDAAEWSREQLDRLRTGKPQLVIPRLGQHSFRLAVLDAYGHSCAVTGEHALPVVEAGHIKPWARGGPHVVPNGLPMRRDLHRLFDLGFVTIEPDLRLRVSRALKDDYRNGRVYYEMAGQEIHLPANPNESPNAEFLEWHGEEVFRA